MKKYLTFKDKITNYQNISMTVKTIEQVAASQIHSYKTTVTNLNEYMSAIKMILARLSLYHKGSHHPLLHMRSGGRRVLLVITSDKGLVGSLYHTMISDLMERKNEYDDIYVIGNRGKQYLQEEHVAVAEPFFTLSEIPLPEEIERITTYFFTKYTEEEIKSVNVLYPSFVSLAEQVPVMHHLLPFTFSEPVETEKMESEPALGFPLFDSNKKDIYHDLLQKHIHSIFYKLIVEAKLSEFASRTIAMEHASAKIDVFRSQISREYFKERRSSITQKQLESFTVHKLL